MKIKRIGKWKIKKRTCQLPHIFNIVCHNFQSDIVQKAKPKYSSKLGFVTMFLQVTSISFAVKPIDEVCVEWV